MATQHSDQTASGQRRLDPIPVSLPCPPDVDYFPRTTWDVERFKADADPFDFHVAELADIAETHSLSEQIMDMRLAPIWALASAHVHTQGTAWVHRSPNERSGGTPAMDGVFLLLPLNWDGEAALRTHRFAFAAPRIDHLCAPGEEMAAMYFWLSAGVGRHARRSVMQTAQAWFDGACAGMRIYGRAASDEGARAFASFGFQPLAPDAPTLFILDNRS
jgi:hypothetical protein